MYRGIENHLDKIRHITAESAIEATIEDTFDTIDSVLRSLTARVSGAWLQENTIHSKVFIELNQVMYYIFLISQLMAYFGQIVNSSHLLATTILCGKALSMAMNLCQEMNLDGFRRRAEKTNFALAKNISFLEDLSDLQILWFHLLPFAKLSLKGELVIYSKLLFIRANTTIY